MRLHGDVQVRLADGTTVEAKHVRTGDRLATADGGAVTLTRVEMTTMAQTRFHSVPGCGLRALLDTSVWKAGSFVPLDQMGAVPEQKEARNVTVYAFFSDWCIYARIPAVECGGLFVRIET